MYTAYALLSNINSGDDPLLFRNFSIRMVSSVGDVRDSKEVFGRGEIGDWIYERTYDEAPEPRGPSGFGRIPFDVEDDLLLMRLFKDGDLAYLAHSIQEPSGSISKQYMQRTMGDVSSPNQYVITQSDCDAWDSFADSMRAGAGWKSDWFRIARRFFLYGGAKEFNPAFQEVDRVVDYMIALEATFVPERDFVGKRLRERCSTILYSSQNDQRAAKKLLRAFYDVRSTIVHGAGLSSEQIKTFATMAQFEQLVRRALAQAVLVIPAENDARKRTVTTLYDIDDSDRREQVVRFFSTIESPLSSSALILDLWRRILRNRLLTRWRDLKTRFSA